MTEPKPSIFISYGRGDDHEDYNDPDKSFLRKLYTDLTKEGYDVWWDRVSMPSRGLNFMQEIQDAISHHDKLTLIVGPHAIGSDYVRYEWQYALQICKPIIPILLKRDPNITEDNAQYSQVPLDVHTINALDWNADDKYTRVLDELKRILGEDAPLGKTHNLPLPPRGYIERDGFAKLQQDLLIKTTNPVVIAPHEQVVAVQGAGGIGKSTLASALAWSCAVRRHYVDGVYWIRLGKQADIVERQATLGRQLGDDGANYVDEQSGRTRLSHLLADKKALLILDDVWDYQQTQAFDVLNATCRMLMTTRQRDIALKTSGEPHALNRLTEAEGLELIGVWLGREPTADNLHEDEERQIVNILGGYTLAIAIASAKLTDKKTGYDHANLLKRLQAGRIFQDIQLDPKDKNLNLEKSLLLSYEDLSQADQQRFRQLGVIAPNADFDMPLIQAVWEDDEFEAEDALNRLVSGALLERDESGRWRQHTVLRAYALALLTDDEQTQAFSRYVEHVTEVAEQFDTLPMQDWDSQIGPDYPHIDYLGDTLTALYNQSPDSYPTLTGDFIWTVQRYVNDRPVLRDTSQGRQWRGLEWFRVGAKLYGDLDQKDRQATTLNNIGRVYDELGNKQTALDYFQQSFLLSRSEGIRNVEAITLNNIGVVFDNLGEKRKALNYHQKALLIKREIGDRASEAITLNNIGQVHNALGNKQMALDYYQQALFIHEEMGYKEFMAGTLNNLGIVHSDLDNKQKALDYFQQGLLYYREVGDQAGEAIALNNIGQNYSNLGDNQKALEHCQHALLIQNKIGDRLGVAATLNNIGLLYSRLGDDETALVYYQKTLPIRREIGDRLGEATTLNNIGGIFFRLNNLEKATEILEQTITIMEDMGTVPDESSMRYNLAVAYQQMNRLLDAKTQVEHAISLLQSKGLKQSAYGTSIEKMRMLLAQLEDEITTPLGKNDMEDILVQLVTIYRVQGKDAVREQLKQADLADEQINEFIAKVERRIQAEDAPQDDEAEKMMKLITADYLQNGEDVVRARLSDSGMDDNMVNQIIADVRLMAQAEVHQSLKRQLENEGEEAVRRTLKSQGTDAITIDAIIQTLRDS